MNSNKNRILFYGIGNQFKECIKLFKDKEIYLFDGAEEKWNTFYNGLKIHRPEEIEKYYVKNSIVVIGCIKNEYEIACLLNEKYNIPKEDIHTYTSGDYEKYVYKNDIIKENWDRIMKISVKLADEESRKYYINSIMARLNRNPFYLIPNPNSKYIGEYVAGGVKLEKDDCIVDCGAYIGDTAEIYKKRLDSKCKIYAFEPFQKSYTKLLERIKDWGNIVVPYNLAVSEKSGKIKLHFDDSTFDMSMNISNIVGDHSQDVNVVTLDSIIEEKVDYIKMDIEGEEKKALIGASNLIRKYHPKLMISAYHRIWDFWELPELIWELNPDYSIFVGHSPGVSMEMEYYCVDNEVKG